MFSYGFSSITVLLLLLFSHLIIENQGLTFINVSVSTTSSGKTNSTATTTAASTTKASTTAASTTAASTTKASTTAASTTKASTTAASTTAASTTAASTTKASTTSVSTTSASTTKASTTAASTTSSGNGTPTNATLTLIRNNATSNYYLSEFLYSKENITLPYAVNECSVYSIINNTNYYLKPKCISNYLMNITYYTKSDCSLSNLKSWKIVNNTSLFRCNESNNYVLVNIGTGSCPVKYQAYLAINYCYPTSLSLLSSSNNKRYMYGSLSCNKQYVQYVYYNNSKCSNNYLGINEIDSTCDTFFNVNNSIYVSLASCVNNITTIPTYTTTTIASTTKASTTSASTTTKSSTTGISTTGSTTSSSTTSVSTTEGVRSSSNIITINNIVVFIISMIIINNIKW